MSSTAPATRIDQFRAAIGSVPLLAPDAAHTVDGIAPDAIALPAHEDELALVLAAARMSGLAVIAVGGGSHLASGNVPEAYDVALSTAALNRTIEHEPRRPDGHRRCRRASRRSANRAGGAWTDTAHRPAGRPPQHFCNSNKYDSKNNCR